MESKWKMLAWYTLFGSSQGSFRRMRSQGYHALTKVHMAYRRIFYWAVYKWVHMWTFSQNYMDKCLSDQQEMYAIAAFQTFLRRNDPDDDRQYMYGISTRNQRTESWWGIIQFWTELFQHLLNKTAGVSLENFWTGILYCSVSYQ